MLERESIPPLALGLVVAIAIHAALIPSATLWTLHTYDGRPRNVSLPAMDPPIAPPPEARFGQETPSAATVAWIAHEDFQKLIAPHGQTAQPALQKDVDPIPGAAMPDLPTPPAPSVPPTPPTPPAPPTPLAPPPRPPLLQLPTPPDPAPALAPSAIRHPLSDIAPSPPSPQPPTPTESKPTSAPRSDAESSPVQLTEQPMPVRPGAVLAAEGLTIATTKPRFSLSTALTALPVDPIARITFAPDGSVTQVQLIRSSGYKDVDGPVEAALYQWKITGDKLKEWNRPITGEWRILLRREP